MVENDEPVAVEEEEPAPKPKREPRIHIREVEISMKSFASILPPVFLTMLLSAIIVLYITPDAADNLEQGLIVVLDEEEADGNGEAAAFGLVNALVIIGVITIMTFLVVLAIKFRCEKCFKGYIVFSLIMLMGFTTGTMVVEGLKAFEIPTDIFSLSFFFFNYATVGALAIFSYEFGFQGKERLIPYWITQLYLIFVSMVMAWLVTTIFPEFTVWLLLVLLALYDLCAVLTPCGPLKLLIDVVTKRQDEDEKKRAERGEDVKDGPKKQLIPGLLYETGTGRSRATQRKRKPEPNAGSAGALNFSVFSAFSAKAGGDEEEKEEEGNAEEIEDKKEDEEDEGAVEVEEENDEVEKSKPKQGKEISEEERAARIKAYKKMKKEHDEFMEMLEHSNLKLGLGDFVFYSVLTAQAAAFGFSAFVSVALVVLCGLCGTLVLLTIYQKALPALPISIAFGLVTYIMVFLFVSPFTDGLALSLVAI